MLLALVLLAFAPFQQSITLEVRTFDGMADVSDATRVIVHRAAQRDQPVGQINPGARPMITVPPGIYDAQALREQSGRLANIRWAERLVVMPYPDENGHHLEVINFQNGYGALEIRGATGRGPEVDVALYRHQRSQQARGVAADHLDLRALRRQGGRIRSLCQARRVAAPGIRASTCRPAVAGCGSCRVGPPSPRTVRPLDHPPAADQSKDDDDQCDDEQDVDQAAGHLEGQAERPQHEQNDDKRPQHVQLPPTAAAVALQVATDMPP